ncbi:MAG: hypothetical protein EYC62_08065 [Alphaproteobacteria bacterium]|nr:MAG: hypothetical protein EYC62_08065 [Alphaproteobacteria bacterium]
MSVVFKFDRAAVAAALAVMGYAGTPGHETSFNRTASIILGNGIGQSGLQQAAVTIQHEKADREQAVAGYMAKHSHRRVVAEAVQAGNESARRVGAKVSDKTRDAALAAAAARREHA